MSLNIQTDRDICIGSENCSRFAPRTFTTDGTGKVVVLDEPRDDDATVRTAVSACPVAALRVEA